MRGAGPPVLANGVPGCCVRVAGLLGRPRLQLKPVRLAFAGYRELWTDLRNNPAWRERVRILFGPTSHSPPIASDFVTERAAIASASATSESA